MSPSHAAGELVAFPASVPVPKQELLYSEIKRLVKSFRRHPCVHADIDCGFVNSVLKEEVMPNDHGEEM